MGELMEPEVTGECVGNDSRCRNASKSQCEALTLQRSDCRWKSMCKLWCVLSQGQWETKCSWRNCMGCIACATTSSSTMTTTTQSSTTTTSYSTTTTSSSMTTTTSYSTTTTS